MERNIKRNVTNTNIVDKKIKKRKMIRLNYDSEEDEAAQNFSLGQLQGLHQKLQYVDQNMRSKNNGTESDFIQQTLKEKKKIPEINSQNSIKHRKNICKLVIENFDNLNLLDLFPPECNLELYLSMFRLYIYSILYNQENSFLATLGSGLDRETFKAGFGKISKINELNYNYADNFRSLQTRILPQDKNESLKTFSRKLVVPPLIKRRLDIKLH